jgi:hypothetical protein
MGHILPAIDWVWKKNYKKKLQKILPISNA